LSHQLVRHRIGISFAQQSQRYVQLLDDKFSYVTPDSWKEKGIDKEFQELLQVTGKLYDRAIKAGIPTEDARFVLPNATTTNFQICVNLAELLHIADLRLCTRAQWEIRRMVSLMKAEVKKALPELGACIQPKCGDKRSGFCDESLSEWEKCPIGKKRPHKSKCA
jgi:thymidylate synthase (FAD)